MPDYLAINQAPIENVDVAHLLSLNASGGLRKSAPIGIKGMLSDSADITVTSSDVTLTDAQNAAYYLNLSGTLTADCAIIVSASLPGSWSVYNGTTGDYTITVKPSGGTGVEITQSTRRIVYSDGAVAVLADGEDPPQPVIISTPVTLSNDAAATFTLDPTKEIHEWDLQNILPVSGSVNFVLLASDDNGSSYSLLINLRAVHAAGSVSAASANSTTGVGLNLSSSFISTSGGGYSGRLRLTQLSGKYANFTFVAGYDISTANAVSISGFGLIATTSPVTNIRLQFSSGNIASGRIIPINYEAA